MFIYIRKHKIKAMLTIRKVLKSIFMLVLVLGCIILWRKKFKKVKEYPDLAKPIGGFLDYSKDYLIEINSTRINELLTILHKNEKEYSYVFKKLDLLMFDELISNSSREDRNVYKKFKKEIKKFLKIDKNVKVKQAFIDQLIHISESNTFNKSRNNVEREMMSGDDFNVVIVTAADHKYYKQLEATVYYVHKYFPNNELIIYDLGLNLDELEQTIRNCKCQVRSFKQLFDFPHLNNLKNYAWKPIIIQDVLIDSDHVMYIDSSISFQSNQIKSILGASKQIGILTTFLKHKLTCYTNWKMFEWFGLSGDFFYDVGCFDANFMIFYRNFVNALMMKAWVTCALDPDCIAPEGSRLWPCCGCHRYDQDAITIITSYFFNLPQNSKSLPPFALTPNESYFHLVDRGHVKKYFIPL